MKYEHVIATVESIGAARRALLGRGLQVSQRRRSAGGASFVLTDPQMGPVATARWDGAELRADAELPPKRKHGGRRSRHGSPVVLTLEAAEAFAAWGRMRELTASTDLRDAVLETMSAARKAWPAE